ncbi:Ubiquitin-conjugating enzyme E2 2 [Forsythia ovata]|uniref:Ubiquitin-conjugating enzyme E2 2 n=1 Tax=Forsythia ovata TaxID=205694 RepID=A0ABD1WAF5_9LAMI
MSTSARKRLMRDFKWLQQDLRLASLTHHVIITLCYGMLLYLVWMTLLGMGTFKLTFQFMADYLNKPPIVRFISTMFHPNIYVDGSICLEILQNQQSPIYDVVAILTPIQSLLCDQNPNSQANSEVARLFSKNKHEYNRKVREIVKFSD